jgi:hypothetical protein
MAHVCRTATAEVRPRGGDVARRCVGGDPLSRRERGVGRSVLAPSGSTPRRINHYSPARQVLSQAVAGRQVTENTPGACATGGTIKTHGDRPLTQSHGCRRATAERERPPGRGGWNRGNNHTKSAFVDYRLRRSRGRWCTPEARRTSTKPRAKRAPVPPPGCFGGGTGAKRQGEGPRPFAPSDGGAYLGECCSAAMLREGSPPGRGPPPVSHLPFGR